MTTEPQAWGPALSVDQIAEALDRYEAWVRRHHLGESATVGVDVAPLVLGLAAGEARPVRVGVVLR